MNNTADDLLQSAVDALTARDTTFIVQPWREIMSKNQAVVEKAKEVKAAAKKVAAKGIQPYKHESTADVVGAGGVLGAFAENQLAMGVDSAGSDVIQSQRHQPNTTGANTVETKTPQTPEAQAAKEAAIKAKIAEKEAKQKAAAEAKAAKEKEKAEKAMAREAAKAERAARPKAAATESMKALADRVKSGTYVKGVNGQLRTDDDVARILELVDVKHTVSFLLKALFMDSNPYEHLNYGQQSMNLRNKLRGALRKGSVKVAGQDVPLTVMYLERLLETNPDMKFTPPAPKVETKETVSA